MKRSEGSSLAILITAGMLLGSTSAGAQAPIFADGFESGDTSAWSTWGPRRQVVFEGFYRPT